MKKLADTPSTVFGSMYTCKAAFYKVNFIKEKYRFWSTDTCFL